MLLKQPRKLVMENVYYGKGYSTAEVRAVLDAQGVDYQYIEDDDELLDKTVETLTSGGVVGWYHGRFGWYIRNADQGEVR